MYSLITYDYIISAVYIIGTDCMLLPDLQSDIEVEVTSLSPLTNIQIGFLNTSRWPLVIKTDSPAPNSRHWWSQSGHLEIVGIFILIH